eukprot:UN08582
MFRDPTDRIISAFHAGKHSNGLPDENRKEMLTDVYGARESKKISTFANYPGIYGCQTKMVLGKQCAERHNLTETDLGRAKKLVDSFYF